MNIIELLEIKGLDTSKKIKLVRHQDKRYNLKELHKRDQLSVYQSYQREEVFNCDIIISFLGLERTKALLIGVFEVGRISPPNTVLTSKDFPYPEMAKKCIHYELKELESFDDLKDRVVIEWGSSTRSWHQWLKKKDVIEIYPKGYIGEFPGLLDFVLPFNELKKIVNNPDANRNWIKMLTSVAGVYLIVDSKTGMQYIGSAYGKDGIFGRWKQYANNLHGGNKELRMIIEQNGESYTINFHFTILRTLEKTLTKSEVIGYEQKYKMKLGSRAFGLNCN